MTAVLIPTTASLPLVPLDRGDVHVWMCDLSRQAHQRAGLAACLSSDEQHRAARFAFDRDRERFILSHGLLRVILSRYLAVQPGRIAFETGVYGKPAVPRGSETSLPIEFSLTHSGQHALVAVANGRAVGVDVEECRREVDALQLAQRFFADGERQRIARAQGHERQQLFYRYWTAKEAYLKGLGVGLSLGLDRFELLFDERLTQAQVRSAESGSLDEAWLVQPLRIADHLAGALAVEGQSWQVQMFDAGTLLP